MRTPFLRTRTRAQSRSIDMNDQEQVRHWMQRFQATEEELRRAVEQVGSGVATVENFILDGRPAKRH
jgi:uncharacterized protein DUF3606